ncbi:MAG: pilus assembly protein PilM [Oscillospiraceae bacterium]|nr:pilus assembly protein PilM [Oscillospiraceae bacterium]
MTTSLFISNESVKIAAGEHSGKKIKVKTIINEQLDEGIMINGVIMDAPRLKTVLESVWKKNKSLSKKVNLTIDSSSLITKILEVPLLNESKLMTYISQNFQDIENYENMLLDYMVLEPHTESGGASVLAVLAEKDFISEYTELLSSLGIKINKIDISLSCLIRIISFTKGKLGNTYIAAVFDKNIVVLVLFVNGKFRFSRRIRIVSEINSEEMFDELVKILSNMIQFNKSEKTNSDITDIYMCGFLSQENQIYKQLSDSLDVKVSAFPRIGNVLMPEGFHEGDFMYPAGNLIK